MMLRLVLVLYVLSSVHLTTSAQIKCKQYTFPDKKVFSNCEDLPQLSCFFHWTYTKATGKLEIAFRHPKITSTNRWVAWAINPKNNLESAMEGAQALVAFPQSSDGAPKVYTSSISSYDTNLEEGNITYPLSGLRATYQNNEVTIFATLTLPKGTRSLVQLWQDGPLAGSTPQAHDTAYDNLHTKETIIIA